MGLPSFIAKRKASQGDSQARPRVRGRCSLLNRRSLEERRKKVRLDRRWGGAERTADSGGTQKTVISNHWCVGLVEN